MVVSVVLLATACGGDDLGGSGGSETTGTPTRGGKVIYGIEAETMGGFCLPEAQLLPSGMMVSRAIYDTLTAPNSEGEYVPYLARFVEPNATFDRWTIGLREGVQFHDGTDLTAEVVKNNLDAYRGAYPNRNPLLFVFQFENIAEVQVLDRLTVSVTTKTPWPAFRAHLFLSGRVGILAQAQLDDPDTCDRDLIGTGPFMLQVWAPNDRLIATRNPDYWQQDSDGTQLPYLDEIEFRPIIEEGQRLNAIWAGEIDAMHTSDPLHIEALDSLASSDLVELTESDQYGEVVYIILNTSRPPFDSELARRAMAHALDRRTINEIRFGQRPTIANGPFSPGDSGYLEDTGWPEFDRDRAAALVRRYEAETGEPFEFSLVTLATPDRVQTGELIQQMDEAVGASVSLRQIEQSQLANQLIAGDFDAAIVRLHPGGDPDTQYIWWHSGSPTNFGRINDDEVDRLLEEGRVTTDPAERIGLYEDLNRRFADQAFNLWLVHAVWAVATAPDVHGVMGPDLPDGGGNPFPGLGSGHPVAGLWIEP